MAGKTPTELNDLIAEVRKQVAVLDTRVGLMKDDFDRADLANLRQRLAVLEAQIADLRKSKETDDQRRWQFWVGVGTLTLTFVASLTVNLLIYFARR
jgi:hypothetical protein